MANEMKTTTEPRPETGSGGMTKGQILAAKAWRTQMEFVEKSTELVSTMQDGAVKQGIARQIKDAKLRAALFVMHGGTPEGILKGFRKLPTRVTNDQGIER